MDDYANTYLLYAGILCIILGLVHSVMGEYLIFHKLIKPSTYKITAETQSWTRKYNGIIWATWHLASILGWCVGAILIFLAKSDTTPHVFPLQVICIGMLAGGLIVAIGTSGKHPGWIVMSIIGILIVLGS